MLTATKDHHYARNFHPPNSKVACPHGRSCTRARGPESGRNCFPGFRLNMNFTSRPLRNSKRSMPFVNRAFPSCMVLEGASDTEEAPALCADLKKDPFTAVVPIVVLVLADQTDLISDWLAAGADEVVSENHTEREQDLRLGLVIRRAQRDVAVHPTTRLPGTVQIERDIGDRLRLQE